MIHYVEDNIVVVKIQKKGQRKNIKNDSNGVKNL